MDNPVVNGALFRLIYERQEDVWNKSHLSTESNIIEATPSYFDPIHHQFVFEILGINKIKIHSFLSYAEPASHRKSLYINKQGALSLGDNSDSSLFQLKPVGSGSELKFHIGMANSDELLVTPSPAAPFKFFRSERYPNEPPVVFISERINLKEAFGNRPDHTPQIIKLIQNGEFGNKTDAYKNLLDIMRKPLTGKEIFDIAYHIKQDLGIFSGPFLQLPSQVQLVVSGEPLVLNYITSTRRTIGEPYTTTLEVVENTMKYNYSSTPLDNVKPYSFNYKNGLWAITYADLHQLSVSEDPPYELIEVLGDTKCFEFQLQLTDGGFGIFSHKNLKNVFHSLDPTPKMPYYFNEWKPPDKQNSFMLSGCDFNYGTRVLAKFSVQKYTYSLE